MRAKVVKYNEQIMNRNWLHLQDGTGATGANDLTVTTAEKAKVGDTVLVKGTLVFDKDFGYGYKYKVMLEDAKLTVEDKTKPWAATTGRPEAPRLPSIASLRDGGFLGEEE